MKPDIDPTSPAVPVVPVVEDPGADPALRALLVEARAAVPVSDAELARMSKRFGAMVGLELVAAAPLAQAPTAPPGLETVAQVGFGQTAAAAKVGSAKVLSGSLAAKVAAASLAVGASLWFGRAARPPAAAPAQVQQVEPARVPPPVAPAPLEPAVEPLVVPVPSEPPRKRAAARVERVEVSVPDELALIREAQSLRGRPAQALSVLAQHKKHYPGGVLAQEREVLAVEALLSAGRVREAGARARSFVEAHPGSVHVARLRALLGADLAQ